MAGDFFKIVFDVSPATPACHGVCAGYERSEWRYKQLVDYVLDEYLLEFCLTPSEYVSIPHNKVRPLLREAFRSIYESRPDVSDANNRRGEFGELLLHALIRENYSTLPAISKIYYKDGINEVVKGFDAVHVVESDGSLELWLGEAKFYTDAKGAIREALSSVVSHLEKDYLRREFMAISHKIDDNWPLAENLKKMLNPRTSLDEVFSAICIPILITYESQTVTRHRSSTDTYAAEIASEIQENYNYFLSKLGEISGLTIKIVVFFIPLENKPKLVNFFDEALEAGQA